MDLLPFIKFIIKLWHKIKLKNSLLLTNLIEENKFTMLIVNLILWHIYHNKNNSLLILLNFKELILINRKLLKIHKSIVMSTYFIPIIKKVHYKKKSKANFLTLLRKKSILL